MRATLVILSIVLASGGALGIAFLKLGKGKSSYMVKENPATDNLTSERRYGSQTEALPVPERRSEEAYVPPDPTLEREALPQREAPPETIVQEPAPPVQPREDFLLPTPEFLERAVARASEVMEPVLPLVVQPTGRDGRPSATVRSSRWIPSHRIIPCRLVSTIETRSMQSPVIAMTTSDVFYQGNIVIPAGTEMHGSVGGTRDGDRVAANNAWRFVFGQGISDPDNGKELPFTAIVLHSAVDEESKQRELSAGFRGELYERDPEELKKLFAYTAIREGYNLAKEATLNSQQRSNNGFQLNNMGAATDAPIDRWVDNQFQRMGNDSYFLRVAGGTAFYLYTMHPIDVAGATLNNAPAGTETAGNAASPSP